MLFTGRLMSKLFTLALASSVFVLSSIPSITQAQTRVNCVRRGTDAFGRVVILPCRIEPRTRLGLESERNCQNLFRQVLVTRNPTARRFAVDAYIRLCSR